MVYKSPTDLAPQYMPEIYQFVIDVSGKVTQYSDKTKLYLARGSHVEVLVVKWC